MAVKFEGPLSSFEGLISFNKLGALIFLTLGFLIIYATCM